MRKYRGARAIYLVAFSIRGHKSTPVFCPPIIPTVRMSSMRERALDKYRREHPRGAARLRGQEHALAGSLKGNKNVYRANSLGQTTSAAGSAGEERERRKMAPRCWGMAGAERTTE